MGRVRRDLSGGIRGRHEKLNGNGSKQRPLVELAVARCKGDKANGMESSRQSLRQIRGPDFKYFDVAIVAGGGQFIARGDDMYNAIHQVGGQVQKRQPQPSAGCSRGKRPVETRSDNGALGFHSPVLLSLAAEVASSLVHLSPRRWESL